MAEAMSTGVGTFGVAHGHMAWGAGRHRSGAGGFLRTLGFHN
jgi:hypothetical protein